MAANGKILRAKRSNNKKTVTGKKRPRTVDARNSTHTTLDSKTSSIESKPAKVETPEQDLGNIGSNGAKNRTTPLAGRTAGSRFTGDLNSVISDLRKDAAGISFEFKDFRESRLLGEFDDSANKIYFQRGRPVGCVTLADEMQHALDFAKTGMSKVELMKEIMNVHKIGPRAAYSWYHRRIFTRAIKNISEARAGFSHLKKYIGEIYDAYLEHGGTLTMQQILNSDFEGLF